MILCRKIERESSENSNGTGEIATLTRYRTGHAAHKSRDESYMPNIVVQDVRKKEKSREAFIREAMNLRNAIMHAYDGSDVRSILLTGIAPGVGTTSVSVALALGLCWDRKTRVILIDANFYAPRLHNVFKDKNSEGLQSFVANKKEITALVRMTRVPQLRIITAGPGGENGAALSSDHFLAAINDLRLETDIIIVDAPALTVNPHVLFWSTCFDGVVLVAAAQATRKRQLREAVRDLERAKANFLGVVLNRETDPLPGFLQSESM